jgi:hypothetical protein
MGDVWRLDPAWVTKPVRFDVTRQNDAYVGAVRIKQTEFGIQPIKIGGGVVRVTDELEISFRVYTASLTRLLYERCTPFGKDACYFYWYIYCYI